MYLTKNSGYLLKTKNSGPYFQIRDNFLISIRRFSKLTLTLFHSLCSTHFLRVFSNLCDL